MSSEVQAILQKTNFSQLDWLIVVAYLAISLVIGVWVKRYATSMSNYIAAGRSVGMWLGVATMTGTEMGLITLMYSAEKGFTGGFAAFHIAVLAGAVTFFVGATGFIVVPLRREGVLTIPEFYERRFGRGTRILGGIMLTLGGVLNMGLFLKVGSQFIVGITGLSSTGWALPTVMTALLLLVLVYTVLGGMISVIITDYIQFVVLSFGLLLTSFLAINRLGWENVFETVERLKGASGFNPLAEGEFGVEYVLWQAFTAGLVSCAIWPTAVARALAMESPTAVRRQYMWSSVSFTIRFLIPYFWGICAFVFIMTEAPELQLAIFGDEARPDVEPLGNLYAMPLFLGRILPAGIIGVITAAMIAAFMSTHDSYLLCWSSVLTQDVISPLFGDRLSTEQRVFATRALIVLIGIYVWSWGLFYQGSDAIWDYMTITGAIYFTGAFAVLFGGLYWSRASRAGAWAALIAGFTPILGLEPIRRPIANAMLAAIGRDVTDANANALLSGHRVGLVTVAFTLLMFVVFSLLIPDRNPSEENN